jgi:hypothetical protein
LICSEGLNFVATPQAAPKEKRAKLVRFALFFLTVNLKKRSLHLLSGCADYFKSAKMHSLSHRFSGKNTHFFR